jgi:hypothetical protein
MPIKVIQTTVGSKSKEVKAYTTNVLEQTSIDEDNTISYYEYMDKLNLFMRVKKLYELSDDKYSELTFKLNALWNTLGIPEDEDSVEIAIRDFLESVTFSNYLMKYKTIKMSL